MEISFYSFQPSLLVETSALQKNVDLESKLLKLQNKKKQMSKVIASLKLLQDKQSAEGMHCFGFVKRWLFTSSFTGFLLQILEMMLFNFWKILFKLQFMVKRVLSTAFLDLCKAQRSSPLIQQISQIFLTILGGH